MKNKLIIAFILVIVSACFPLFFGGKVVGPYIKHYNGQMECAFVDGWNKEITCVCWLLNFPELHDKVFLTLEDNTFCETTHN